MTVNPTGLFITCPEKMILLFLQEVLFMHLCTQADNRLWIGTDKGLSVLDLKNYRFVNIKKDPVLEPLTHSAVLSFAHDASNVWIGTDKCLYRYEPDKKIRTSYLKEELNNQSLPGSQVTSLLIGRNKDLWVGTENGLAQMKAGTEIFRNIWQFFRRQCNFERLCESAARRQGREYLDCNLRRWPAYLS